MEKSLIILHLVESFAGGTASFIIHLTKNMPEHEHIVFHGKRAESDETLVQKRFPNYVKFESWKYVQREIKVWQDILALWVLIKFIKNAKCDVIHLHSSKAGFLGRVAGWILRKKMVFYTPNAAPFVREDISENKRKLYIFLEKIAANLSGTVVCCSDSELAVYKKYKIKAIRIFNGTDITFPAIIRKIPTQKLTIVTTGRLAMQKNPALFNQIAKAFESDESVEFIWVGDGELRALLTAKNIRITGWLPSADVQQLLKQADLYISTALWEGLPFAVLEAMNLSMPLLLSRSVGNVDLVEEGKNGFIFDEFNQAFEKINYINQHRNLLPIFSEYSRKMCEDNFDVIKISKQYNKIYYNQSIISNVTRK